MHKKIITSMTVIKFLPLNNLHVLLDVNYIITCDSIHLSCHFSGFKYH